MGVRRKVSLGQSVKTPIDLKDANNSKFLALETCFMVKRLLWLGFAFSVSNQVIFIFLLDRLYFFDQNILLSGIKVPCFVQTFSVINYIIM